MTKDELLKIFDLATMQHTDYGYETLRSKVQEIAREALAEHAMREVQRLGQEIEQEPVISKWVLREVYFDEDGEPISHRSPPQRTWVGLTEDERDHLTGLHLYAVRGQVEAWIEGVDDFAQAIEAKLKDKNT